MIFMPDAVACRQVLRVPSRASALCVLSVSHQHPPTVFWFEISVMKISAVQRSAPAHSIQCQAPIMKKNDHICNRKIGRGLKYTVVNLVRLHRSSTLFLQTRPLPEGEPGSTSCSP